MKLTTISPTYYRYTIIQNLFFFDIFCFLFWHNSSSSCTLKTGSSSNTLDISNTSLVSEKGGFISRGFFDWYVILSTSRIFSLLIFFRSLLLYFRNVHHCSLLLSGIFVQFISTRYRQGCHGFRSHKGDSNWAVLILLLLTIRLKIHHAILIFFTVPTYPFTLLHMIILIISGWLYIR